MRCYRQFMSGVVGVLAISASAIDFKVVRNHADCMYKCGEVAEFTVTAFSTNDVKATSGKVAWSLDYYNMGDPIRKGEVDLSASNPFVVKGTLNKPGFLRLQLKADGFREPNLVRGWSVGYEPLKIRKMSPMPRDFDAFWAAGRKKLAAEVPLDVRIVPYPEKSSEYWNYYRISFATFGRRIYGFFSTPKDETKKYPARLHVASAGWGNWTNFQPGKRNLVYLWLSVYPFEPSWDWKTDGTTEKFEKLNRDLAKRWGWGGYENAGLAGKRDDAFFYSVTLGMDRAIDWLVEHPLTKRDDVTYFGGSQSGGLGIYLMGLNHRFRKGIVTVPAWTDLMAHLDGRLAAGPRPWENAPESERAAVDRNLPYYDAANFASRVKCPIRFSVGFRDGTCYPPCVYAAYNEVKSDKSIYNAVDNGHGMPDDMYSSNGRWLDEK